MTIDKPRTEFDGNNIIDLLLWRAEVNSNSLAYTYLANGHIEDCKLTYQQLKCRVLEVGAQLQAVGAKGDRVLLLYPQGLDFIIAFLGCLSAGMIAIPVSAPGRGRLKRTLLRLKAVIDDAEASIALTATCILEIIEGSRSDYRYLNALNWIDTTDRSASVTKEWHTTEVSPSTAAYLQYTSGSTSTPKGVIISHKNLLQHLQCLQTSCGYTSDSVTVTWMPHFHDYGLVEGIMEPLFNGTPSYLMSPFAFIKRPLFWLKAISSYKATHSQAPNFAYARCVQRVSLEDQEMLDLSSWVQAANAAEPINPRVMLGFYERFKSCGFHWETFMPGYGLAENTLAVSMSPVFVPPVFSRFDSEALGKLKVVESAEGDQYGTMFAGCGRPIQDTVVAIVNPETRKRCAADSVGEIWISSAGVASGYWRRPEESEITFRAEIVDEHEEGKTYLRSGDLGFIREGELFITGRLKDLIIIGGVNHWPHDIEWTVEESHPAVRPGNFCAAFSVDADDGERLVVVAEIQRSWTNFKEIYNSVTQAISESHDLMLQQLVLVKSGSVPKTSMPSSPHCAPTTTTVRIVVSNMRILETCARAEGGQRARRSGGRPSWTAYAGST
jgi:acyl-CoA synthetase (AMP-forming)/AMP-acid ligase II